jgi:hypothetical protein
MTLAEVCHDPGRVWYYSAKPCDDLTLTPGVRVPG